MPLFRLHFQGCNLADSDLPFEVQDEAEARREAVRRLGGLLAGDPEPLCRDGAASVTLLGQDGDTVFTVMVMVVEGPLGARPA